MNPLLIALLVLVALNIAFGVLALWAGFRRERAQVSRARDPRLYLVPNAE